MSKLLMTPFSPVKIKMIISDEIYEAREDSFLLAESIKKYAKGKVLDMGTGSGIQGKTALKSKVVKTVTFADRNSKAIEHVMSTVKSKKTIFIRTDLFSKIKDKYDTIIFNPPYLPDDPWIKDIALDGGKKGYELTVRFLEESVSHLENDGQILLLFSSYTNKNIIDETIKGLMLESEEIARQRLFQEVLYVYRITKSGLHQILEKKGYSDIRFLAKGNRGAVFTLRKGRKYFCLKTEIKKSGAVNRIENEIDVLKVVNKEKIGPKLIDYDRLVPYFIMEYIEGIRIEEYIQKNRKQAIIKAIKELLTQMRKLDILKINKKEMDHPYKHVQVKKDGPPVLIDFERAKKTIRPKNVSQFCQFLTSGFVNEALKQKQIVIDKEKIRKLAGIYKEKHEEKDFINIIKLIR